MGRNKKMAEVVVIFPDGGSLKYCVRYQQGREAWVKIAGGEPEPPPDFAKLSDSPSGGPFTFAHFSESEYARERREERKRKRGDKQKTDGN